MTRLRLIAPLLIVSACSSGSPEEQARDTLRVSIKTKTGPIESQAGDVAHLFELVYRPAADYFSSVAVTDDTLALIPRTDLRQPLAALAAQVRSPGLGAFKATGDRIEVGIPPGARAPTLAEIYVDTGPFEEASVTPDRLVLKRRSGVGIGTIEVVGTSGSEEEWRRLLARDVDLLPNATPGDLRYLAEVPSVRIIPIEQPSTSGLILNASGRVLNDVRLRRAVSLALRRKAIAEVAAGDPGAAVAAEEDGDQARALLAGSEPTLRVLVWSSLSDDQRAAMVMEQQLAEVGFRVTVRLVSTEEGESIVFGSRDFDVLLLYAGFEPVYFRRALSSNRANITGYANPEFDAAVAANDNARAVQILKRDVPFVPLYRINEGVAMNAGFCGTHPKTSYDLSWLADVHVCKHGESE